MEEVATLSSCRDEEEQKNRPSSVGEYRNTWKKRATSPSPPWLVTTPLGDHSLWATPLLVLLLGLGSSSLSSPGLMSHCLKGRPFLDFLTLCPPPWMISPHALTWTIFHGVWTRLKLGHVHFLFCCCDVPPPEKGKIGWRSRNALRLRSRGPCGEKSGRESDPSR